MLVLTKPLGTGVIATALKAGQAPEEVVDAATRSMATLNRMPATVAACGTESARPPTSPASAWSAMP